LEDFSTEFPPVHCEKSLFVLASLQKIPVLRTENSAVDTRTICLLPIEFIKLPMPEKLRPENPGQKQQIRPENSASCNYRNGWKISVKKTTNRTQGCSGAVVEYLLPNLQVEGSLPPYAQILFRWRRKFNRKFRPTCQKLFLLYVRNESAAPGLGSGKSRQAL
jgi:hypothetical protein